MHRHRHNRLSTAYAYRSELDAWWHNRPMVDDEASDPDVSGVAGRLSAARTVSPPAAEAEVLHARVQPPIGSPLRASLRVVAGLAVPDRPRTRC